VKMEMKYVVDY